jgi:hypothetical protein
MKTKFTLFVVLLLTSTMVSAQMPNGTAAPDWTVTDVFGGTHTLSSIAASGKAVGLKFSATWCGPCYTYHNQHHMRTAYDNWGPNGTDQIEMFYLEASPSTNQACLFGPAGCVGGTQGDWVTGTPYHTVHLEGANQNLGNTYQILGYPTLYAVSPDMRVYWIGSWTGATPSVWEDWLIESFSLEATATTFDAVCGGDGEIDLDPIGGYNNVSYAWSNGASTEDLTGLDEGTYTVTLTDSHGYDIVRTFDVDGPSQGALGVDLLGVDDVTCKSAGDGVIEVEAFGSTGSGYTYDWSNGMTGPLLTGLDGGNYDVTVTGPSGCQEFGFYFVWEPDEVGVNYFSQTAACDQANGEIDAEATGGTFPFTYELDGGMSNTSGLFQNLAGGDYELKITDGNQCEKVFTIAVDNEPAPVAMAESSNDIDCAATTATLSGVGSTSGADVTYLWTTTTGNIVSGADQLNAVVDAAGDYELKVTNTAVNCETTTMVSVAQDFTEPMLSVSDNVDLTCTVAAVQLCATTDAANTVTWMLPSGPVQQNCVIVDAASTYTAEAVASNGCSTSAQVVVGLSDDQPQVTVSTPSMLTCAEPSTDVVGAVQGDITDYTFAWTTSDGAISGASDTPSIIVTSAGTYTLVVTDIATGCAATQLVTIESDAALPSPSFDYVLVDGQLTLTNTSDVTDNVSWSYGNNQSSDMNEIIVEFAENGDYEVCVTVTNECGPAEQCQVVTYVVDLVAAPTAADVLCFGESTGVASVNPAGGLPPYTVTWTNAAGDTWTGETVMDLAPGDYTFEMFDDFGYTESGAVSIAEPAMLELGTADVVDESAVGASDGSISLTAMGGTGTLTYLWSNGATTATISDLAPGDYTCEITDENGCTVLSPTYTVAAAPTSVSEIAGLQSVNVFPVPVQDRVTLVLELDRSIDGQAMILNVAGSVVSQRSIQGSSISETFDMTSLQPGLYFVRVATESGVYTEKIIKLDR